MSLGKMSLVGEIEGDGKITETENNQIMSIFMCPPTRGVRAVDRREKLNGLRTPAPTYVDFMREREVR